MKVKLGRLFLLLAVALSLPTFHTAAAEPQEPAPVLQGPDGWRSTPARTSDGGDVTSPDYNRGDILASWDEAAMERAVSLDPPNYDPMDVAEHIAEDSHDGISNSTFGPQSAPAVEPMEHTAGAQAVTNGSSTAVGKIFGRSYTGVEYECSGSLINTPNERLIVTAGHCIFNFTTKALVSDLVFVPSYRNDVAPLGRWEMDAYYYHTDWWDNGNYTHDYAFATLYVPDGQSSPVYTAGANGWQANGGNDVTVNVMGYPINFSNGQVQKQESLASRIVSYANPPIRMGGLFQDSASSFGGGASGGPWLENFDTSVNLGQIRSVTSLGFNGRLLGPYFDDDFISGISWAGTT